MKVNVYTRTKGADRDFLLAIPTNPDGKIPREFHKHWQYLATVDTSDAMFRSVKVEDELSSHGYCVFTP